MIIFVGTVENGKIKYDNDMKKTIAFDVDGTLINMKNAPKYWVIELLLWFKEAEWDIIIWSGGGVDYAQMVVRKLGLEEIVRVVPKGSEKVDIAVDDMADGEYNIDQSLAKVIIKV